MTSPLSADDSTDVRTREEAAVLAYDTLDDAGCESIVTSLPRQTRSTWIVSATTDSGSWRVHIDPRSGATRSVRVEE